MGETQTLVKMSVDDNEVLLDGVTGEDSCPASHIQLMTSYSRHVLLDACANTLLWYFTQRESFIATNEPENSVFTLNNAGVISSRIFLFRLTSLEGP